MASEVAGGQQLAVDGDVMSVQGALTTASVVPLLARGRGIIGSLAGPTAVLDLGAVTASDSSGLALVVDWLRTAHARGLSLSVRNVPSQMMALADISGLETLLNDGETDAS